MTPWQCPISINWWVWPEEEAFFIGGEATKRVVEVRIFSKLPLALL